MAKKPKNPAAERAAAAIMPKVELLASMWFSPLTVCPIVS